VAAQAGGGGDRPRVLAGAGGLPPIVVPVVMWYLGPVYAALAVAGRADAVRQGRAGDGVKELLKQAETAPVDVRALTCLALEAIGVR